MSTESTVYKQFELAVEQYAQVGVDVRAAMMTAATLPLSIHCWQGDDVGGYENDEGATGGIAATGHYPGRAKTPDQLRTDISKAMSMIPGKHKLNLHAIYADQAPKERTDYTPEHFSAWMDWAQAQGIGLDFNPTFFAHPKAADHLTLSNPDPSIRAYWIEHGKACRRVAEAFGKRLGQVCVDNFWMPDGSKDLPYDTVGPRERMIQSLDEIFKEPMDAKYTIDAVESKLFGIGVESYTVGSHEFQLGYALTRGKLLCMDAGHFHPTEVISSKISAVLAFMPQVLLHVSRPVRWDSDHVVLFDDELRSIFFEIVRGGFQSRVYVALDFFDASINRVAAWVIGSRNAQRALLYALLEPGKIIRDAEAQGDYTSRLAWMEEEKTMPFAAVWDMYCLQQNVPVGASWLDEVKAYERTWCDRS